MLTALSDSILANNYSRSRVSSCHCSVERSIPQGKKRYSAYCSFMDKQLLVSVVQHLNKPSVC